MAASSSIAKAKNSLLLFLLNNYRLKWLCRQNCVKHMSDAHKNRATAGIERICQTFRTVWNTLLLKKGEWKERSVIKFVAKISYLAVPPENESAEKVYHLKHSNSLALSRLANNTASGTPTETDLPKNSSLLLLHLKRALRGVMLGERLWSEQKSEGSQWVHFF